MSHILRELLEAVVLALLVFFVIRISIQNFRVEGYSMRPTLDGGEYLVVNKLSYFRIDMRRLARLVPFWEVDTQEENYLPFSHPPERGDVIVFHASTRPQRDFVKRVIGLPGERVRITSGKVYVNDKQVKEPYLDYINPSESMDCIPKLKRFNCRLQDEQYFVMGDNRDNSNDSRDWGPVHLEDIVGKVWFIYWPLSELPIPFFKKVDEQG